MPVVVDGVQVTTPYLVSWLEGSVHTVAAQNSSSSTLRRQFVRWSNGGAQSQSFTASSSTPMLTADYSSSYSLRTQVSPANAGTITISPVSPDGFYAVNSTVAVTATPAPGYCLTSWSDLLPGTPAQTSVTMTRPYALVANFGTGSFSLATNYQYISSPQAGNYQVGVTGSGGCGWTAVTNVPWITITSPVNNTGSAVVTYSLAPNPNVGIRVGIIEIAGKWYIVAQAGQ
jgi:hypothetical protein